MFNMQQHMMISEQIPSGVNVWRIDLAHTLSSYENSDWAILSVQEKWRAERFIHLKDRIRFVTVRAALRKLVGQHLSCLPEEIFFQTGPYGKPHLENNLTNNTKNVYFNVTHSGDFALIALSDIGEVGIDIEYCDPSLNIHDLANIVLTSHEYQHILSSSTPLKTFFQHWVGKEAVLKALGLGIGTYLQQISLFPQDDGHFHLLFGDFKDQIYFTCLLDAPESYMAALALANPHIP